MSGCSISSYFINLISDWALDYDDHSWPQRFTFLLCVPSSASSLPFVLFVFYVS